MIVVVGQFRFPPEQMAAALPAMRKVMEATRAEDGCIEYQPVIDADGLGPNHTALGPDTFVVIEKWASMDALKAHAASAHMAAYAAKTREHVAGRVVHVLQSAA